MSVRLFCQNITGAEQWLVAGNTAPTMARSPRADQNAQSSAAWNLEAVGDGFRIKSNRKYICVDLDSEAVSLSKDPDQATTFEFNLQDYTFLKTYTLQVQGTSRYLIGRTGDAITPSVGLGTTGTKPQAMWTLFQDERPN